MNEKIKTQLRAYLNTNLQLCKLYMQEQDLTAAKMAWQRAIGAVNFTSISVFNLYYDNDFSTEIEAIWEEEYQEAFNKVLLPDEEEVGE